jgi:hypothetical protein
MSRERLRSVNHVAANDFWISKGRSLGRFEPTGRGSCAFMTAWRCNSHTISRPPCVWFLGMDIESIRQRGLEEFAGGVWQMMATLEKKCPPGGSQAGQTEIVQVERVAVTSYRTQDRMLRLSPNRVERTPLVWPQCHGAHRLRAPAAFRRVGSRCILDMPPPSSDPAVLAAAGKTATASAFSRRRHARFGGLRRRQQARSKRMRHSKRVLRPQPVLRSK